MEIQKVEATPVKIQDKKPLKKENELFCRYYVERHLPAVQAYGLAYNIDTSNRMQYMVAAANASKLLKKPKIVARVNELLDLVGFNDAGVDKQLNFLIQQHDDKKTKLGAIKEYNALKKRTGESKKNVFSGNTFNLTQLLDQAEK